MTSVRFFTHVVPRFLRIGKQHVSEYWTRRKINAGTTHLFCFSHGPKFTCSGEYTAKKKIKVEIRRIIFYFPLLDS